MFQHSKHELPNPTDATQRALLMGQTAAFAEGGRTEGGIPRGRSRPNAQAAFS